MLLHHDAFIAVLVTRNDSCSCVYSHEMPIRLYEQNMPEILKHDSSKNTNTLNVVGSGHHMTNN